MKKTALITGASNGIGIEFARIFASRGDNLVLVARNIDKIEALKPELEKEYGISVYCICKDLTELNAPKSVFDEIREQNIEINYLINNAGFGDFGLFAQSDWEKQMNMINLNITALTYFTRLFLPDMIKKSFGKILNVASTAAFQPGPTMSVYFATKAFVLSFSEAIAEELKESGVTVTVLCPGATDSDFKSKTNLHDSNLYKGNNVATAKEVANFGFDKMMEEKIVAIPGFINNVLAQTARFAPRRVVASLTRRKLESK